MKGRLTISKKSLKRWKRRSTRRRRTRLEKRTKNIAPKARTRRKKALRTI